MKRLSYVLAGLLLTTAPAFAQNLTLPAGSEALGARADVAVPAAQPVAQAQGRLAQGRSVFEGHEQLHHRRQHR